MGLLRCLFFFEAHFSCQLVAKYLPGPLNDRADDLSRNHLFSFLSKVPQADKHPTLLHRPLLQLLDAPQQDLWTSPHWIQLFKSCVPKV